MTPTMKFAMAPVLALAATFAPLAASAGEANIPIVVTSPEALAAWKAEANTALNRALEREPRRRNLSPSSGVVQLTFEMDDEGRPTNIELQSNTANRAAARTAQHAVRWLGDISDVPVADPEDARFFANIIFANSAAQHRKLSQQLERSERERLASGGQAIEYIVLGG